MKFQSKLFFVFIFFFHFNLQAQSNDPQPSGREKIKFSSFGLGIHSLGLSEFNQVFKALNLPETPTTRYALYYSRMSYPVGTKIFTGFSFAAQSYIVANDLPGEISYTFAKQNIDFNAGTFIIDNELLAVPVYGGAGLSFMIFNSHINFNNNDKDFSDVLVNGSGTGIFNMTELSVNGSLVTGIDFKTSYFQSRPSAKASSLNIGIRTGIMYAPFQLPVGITGVSGIPQTDRFNYFISLNFTRFIAPCN